MFDVDPAADVDALAMVPGGHGTLRMPTDEKATTPGSEARGLDSPRRWWIVPAAVVAIAAVFGAVALLAGTDDATRTSASTSAPSTSAAGAAVVAVIPATPFGYVVTGVQRSTAATSAPTGMVTELYATHVESASLSSWVQITAGPAGGWYEGTGDSRVAVPAGVAVFGNRRDGSLTLSGPISGGGAIVASSGVSRDVVHEMFDLLKFERGRLRIFDDRLGTTFLRVAADDAAAGGGARGSSQVVDVTYARIGDASGPPEPSAVDRPDSFTVITGPIQPPSQEVTRRFFLNRAKTLTVAGQHVVVGADTREHGITSVVLERAGRQVTVSGTAPRDVIVAAITTMRIADDAALERLGAVEPPQATNAQTPGIRLVIGSGVLDNGRSWQLSADLSTIDAPPPGQHSAVTSLIIGSDGSAFRTPITPQTVGITIVATPALTAVVAFIPRNLDGAVMVVTIGAQERTVQPAAVGEGDLVASFGFVSLDPFTVDIRSNGRALSSASG